MRGRGSLVLAVGTLLALLAGSGYVLAPARTASRAVDVSGRPVPGATVTVISRATRPYSTVTGMNGVFAFPTMLPLPVVLPQVKVSAPGFLDYQGRAGQTVVLHRRPLLFGRVVDDVGAAIDHGVVTVTVNGGQWQAVTDGQGFFRLDGVLDSGPASVLVTAGQHDAYREEPVLAADHAFQVEGTMNRQLGTLEITTDPAGVPVTFDGQPLADCPATPCSPEVAVGRHALAIAADGYVPWSADVTVWEGARLPVPVTLVRKTGTLVVTAPAGAGAVLMVDGQRVNGLSWTGTLTTGPHSVTYSAADHWPASVTANVPWNQTLTVNVASAAVVPGDEAGFAAGMAQYLGSLPGRFSAWIAPLGGGRELGHQPDTVMEAASVIKLPLAIYVERQAQDGKIKMSDTVQLEDGDFMGGTGTLYGTANAGDSYSYHDLLALLVQQSDNTAWKALDRVLGASQVDAYAAGQGAPDCHQRDDGCSSRQAGLLMQQLARGALLDQGHTSELLGLLESTVFNDRINYYLGGYRIAHKVGMDGSVMNDTGAVLAPHPFVVSMFTDADPQLGVEAIRQVSRLAARLYGD